MPSLRSNTENPNPAAAKSKAALVRASGRRF